MSDKLPYKEMLAVKKTNHMTCIRLLVHAPRAHQY